MSTVTVQSEMLENNHSMSESSEMKESEEPVRYHHEFTKEELEQMMYQWDEGVDPVKEYHYMKTIWQTEGAIIGKKPKDWMPPKQVEHNNSTANDLKQGAKDSKERTEVDLNKDAPADEELVVLDLDTYTAVHIIEFYAVCGLSDSLN